MSDRFRGLTVEDILDDMRALEEALGGRRHVIEKLGVARSSWADALLGYKPPSANIITALYGPAGSVLKGWIAAALVKHADSQESATDAPAEPPEQAPDHRPGQAPEADDQAMPPAEVPASGAEPQPGLAEHPQFTIPDWMEPALDALEQQRAAIDEQVMVLDQQLGKINDAIAALMNLVQTA